MAKLKKTDILLTNSEIEDEIIGDDWLVDMSWVCKAQCIKLLEWQKQRCTSHTSKRKRLGMSAHFRRWECPYCDAEIEAMLKGGSNG